MKAGGVARQTGRRNTIMPYNVGFLNKADDTENYNVAVYDELQKVSTATTHMFQALDDIHAEIDQRIAALNAMNLKFDILENRITTEIETAIADIRTEMGNLSTDDIWDNSVNPPTKLNGTVAGIKTSIEGVDKSVQTVQGIVNDQGEEIALVQTTLTSQGQQISNVDGKVTSVQNSLTSYMKLTDYEATWGVSSTVNGKTAGVRLANNGSYSQFEVTAHKFVVRNDAGQGSTPFVIENGRAKMDYADIKNVNVTTAQIANARINYANIDNVSVSSAQIQAAAIHSALIADHIQSDGWNAGYGWYLGRSAASGNQDQFYMRSGPDGTNRVVLSADGLSVYAGNVLRVRVGRF